MGIIRLRGVSRVGKARTQSAEAQPTPIPASNRRADSRRRMLMTSFDTAEANSERVSFRLDAFFIEEEHQFGVLRAFECVVDDRENFGCGTFRRAVDEFRQTIHSRDAGTDTPFMGAIVPFVDACDPVVGDLDNVIGRERAVRGVRDHGHDGADSKLCGTGN